MTQDDRRLARKVLAAVSFVLAGCSEGSTERRATPGQFAGGEQSDSAKRRTSGTDPATETPTPTDDRVDRRHSRGSTATPTETATSTPEQSPTPTATPSVGPGGSGGGSTGGTRYGGDTTTGGGGGASGGTSDAGPASATPTPTQSNGSDDGPPLSLATDDLALPASRRASVTLTDRQAGHFLSLDAGTRVRTRYTVQADDGTPLNGYLLPMSELEAYRAGEPFTPLVSHTDTTTVELGPFALVTGQYALVVEPAATGASTEPSVTLDLSLG